VEELEATISGTGVGVGWGNEDGGLGINANPGFGLVVAQGMGKAGRRIPEGG